MCAPVAQEVLNRFRVVSSGSGRSQAMSLICKSQTFKDIVMDGLIIELTCQANWGLNLADLV